MKKILFMLVAAIALLATPTQAKTNADNPTQQENSASPQVEVLYFHGKQRCATCMAIEKNARAAVSNQLAAEVKSGKVVFKTIDISQKANEKLAEKYQVTWSSLFVVGHKDGKESAKNLTPYAFQQARKDPEGFKKGLVQTVKDLLK